MLDASQLAVSFALGKSLEHLDTDLLLLSGIVHKLAILGEAAVHVSLGVKNHFSHIPWRKMIGLRNRLIHAYFELDNPMIWLIVTESLPPLIQQLQEILQDLEDIEEEVAHGSESTL